jgi:hypothetical protein
MTVSVNKREDMRKKKPDIMSPPLAGEAIGSWEIRVSKKEKVTANSPQ